MIKNLPTNTPELNDIRNKWIDRAKAVGLTASNTPEEVMAAEGSPALKPSAPVSAPKAPVTHAPKAKPVAAKKKGKK